MTSGEHPEPIENPSSLIDHTLLKPAATREEIVNLCTEARAWKFASVCLNPCWVTLAVRELAGSGVKVCTVIGFPLGANETQAKLTEAELALEQGARELDVVQNIGALRSGDVELVSSEIAALSARAHAAQALLKVIIETSLLSDEEKRIACRIAAAAGADFVKTSTGFSGGGATAADVRLMRQAAGPAVRVKASGGVRSFSAVEEMVRAGAARIGTSSGVQIMQEAIAATGERPLDRTASEGY